MRDKKLLGALGEEFAANFLYAEGYDILERNYTSYFGEIDIICEKEGTVYFVEVKTRTTVKYGDPVEAVGKNKAIKIRKTAEYYMMKKKDNRNAEYKVFEILARETSDDFELM